VRPNPGRGARSSVRLAVRHLLPLVAALVFLLPLYWMFAGSLRQPALPPPRGIEWVPNPVSPENYARIFELIPLARYALNSLIVALIAVPITLVVASWAGFAMTQLSIVDRRRMVLLSIGLLLVPITSLWLTRYVLFTWVGIVDSYLALIAPALMGSSPLFVLLFYWTFRRTTVDIFDQARLDGAGSLRIWWSIAMPLAGPTIVAVSVLAFLAYWSDFISPLLYLKSEDLYTLPVGLRLLQQLDRTNWPLLMAGCVLMTVPTILMFAAVQRYFLRDGRFSGGPERRR
jgi:multiple sugar transport system permease protein